MDATAKYQLDLTRPFYDGPSALTAIPEESSSDSHDPDLRYDVFPDDGRGYCTRDKFFARYGPIDV